MISRFTDRQRPISGPRRAVRPLSVLQGLKTLLTAPGKAIRKILPVSYRYLASGIPDSNPSFFSPPPPFSTLYFPGFITGNWSNLVRIRNNRSKDIDRQMEPRVNYPWNICVEISLLNSITWNERRLYRLNSSLLFFFFLVLMIGECIYGGHLERIFFYRKICGNVMEIKKNILINSVQFHVYLSCNFRRYFYILNWDIWKK